MNEGHLPTELACLARQMLGVAEELTRNAQALPSVWGAVTNYWATDKISSDDIRALMHDMLVGARTLVFAAQSLNAQVAVADGRARDLYGMTMEVVDGIRMRRALYPNNPEMGQLADFCIGKLADMQECIAEQFPGETIPGG